MLLRASCTSQTVIYHGDPALVLASVGANTTETVRGSAGTGWIPGYFGVATGTMASDVAVFGNIRYWHDLSAGEGGFGGCAHCSTTEPLCRFCFTTESGEKIDKTPNTLLITMAGISSSGGTSDCSNIANYNDTFAVPFYTDDYAFGDDGVGNCFWQVSGGDNCNHPNVDYILDEIIIRLRGWTNGTDVGFEIRAQLLMHSDIFGFGGTTGGQITWTEVILDSELPSYDEDFPSIDCIEVLDDWIALNDSTAKTGWAASMPGTPTASVKIA